MLVLGQAGPMSPATIPTIPPVAPTTEAATKETAPAGPVAPQTASNGSASSPETPSAHEDHARRPEAVHDASSVPDEVENIVLRVAAPDEEEAVSELARRAGAPRPTGALMVAAIDGRLVAAVSITCGDTVREPSPLRIAAAAVARYRVARLARGRGPARAPAIAA